MFAFRCPVAFVCKPHVGFCIHMLCYWSYVQTCVGVCLLCCLPQYQATSAGDAAVPQTLTNFLLVTLIQTGALWQYSTRPDSPTPFLLATPVRRAQPVSRLPSAALPRLATDGANPAAAARSAVPSGFWQGAVSGCGMQPCSMVDLRFCPLLNGHQWLLGVPAKMCDCTR